MKQVTKALFLPNYIPPKDVEVLKMGMTKKRREETTYWFKVGKMVFGVTKEQAIKAGWLIH